MRSGRGKDVAASKRGAWCHQLVGLVREHYGTTCASGHRDGWSQQTVVRSDEHAFAIANLDGNGQPVGANARIDNRQHDARRHVRNGSGEGERSGAHIERGHLVGDVDDGDMVGEIAHDALDDPDELIDRAVVGKE